MRDYVLISQDIVRVEHFSRQESGWLLQTLSFRHETLHLPSVDLELSVEALYDEMEIPTQLVLLPSIENSDEPIASSFNNG